MLFVFNQNSFHKRNHILLLTQFLVISLYFAFFLPCIFRFQTNVFKSPMTSKLIILVRFECSTYLSIWAEFAANRYALFDSIICKFQQVVNLFRYFDRSGMIYSFHLLSNLRLHINLL